jgi:FAD/FMN-containing dehydrogenase
MKIIKQGVTKWNNLHRTVSMKVVDVYDLGNEQTGSALERYNDSTKGVMGLIRESVRTGVPIRPLGGNWSLSPIAATPGIVLNTKPLNLTFSVSKDSLDATYTKPANRLCFAQCGASIWELNDFLRPKGQSLSACGASNGQTIAGAMATGTHGAAIQFGAIQDAAVGIHLIVGPDRHIWLERASEPVVNQAFADKLGATLMRDDEAFNAAITGLGAFGFVHGVLLETEDLYLLEAYLRRLPYDDAMKQQITQLDWKLAALPYPGEKPFHFQFLINPYDLKEGAYMTTMYKRPYAEPYTRPKPNGEGIGPGDDAPCFIGKLAGAVPGLVPTLVNKVLGGSLKPYEKVTGTLSEIFNNTTLRGKVASAAIGFAVRDVPKVVDLVLNVNAEQGPFAGLFAFRFVKKSRALMAFTRFDPTCVLEMDGVQSDGTMHFYEKMWEALDKAGIAYTFHWGKMNSMTPARLERAYGQDAVRFQAARQRVLDPGALLAFDSTAHRDWGLYAEPDGTALV